MGKVKMQIVTRLTITDATTDDCERDYRTITTFWGGYSVSAS